MPGGSDFGSCPGYAFLQDTDGDDQADIREILFTGFGINDTHAGPSNLRYGLDNWIYGTVGYSGFKGEVNGEEYKFSFGYLPFQIGWFEDGVSSSI